jgi:hypothetical protein
MVAAASVVQCVSDDDYSKRVSSTTTTPNTKMAHQTIKNKMM